MIRSARNQNKIFGKSRVKIENYIERKNLKTYKLKNSKKTMKIDCKIKSIGELRSGVNAKTGNTWHMLPVEIEWQEARTHNDGTIFAIDNTLVVDIAGDQAKNFTLSVGQAITIDVHFSVTDWNGKKLNNMRSSFIILR